MVNTRQFVKANNIRAKSEWVDRNPHMDDFKGNHYKVKLQHGNKQMTTYFSMGYGLKGEPTAEQVIDCLASDAYTYDNKYSHEEFCREYGYDTDSIRAKHTYDAVMKQSAKLEKFLGEDKFGELLQCERL